MAQRAASQEGHRVKSLSLTNKGFHMFQSVKTKDLTPLTRFYERVKGLYASMVTGPEPRHQAMIFYIGMGVLISASGLTFAII